MADRRRGTPPPLWLQPDPPATPEAPELPHPHPVRVALRWIRWRLIELGCVAVPVVMGATVHWLFAAAAAPVIGLWVWHEIQLRDVPRRGSHG